MNNHKERKLPCLKIFNSGFQTQVYFSQLQLPQGMKQFHAETTNMKNPSL
jgi:hypothetical protein